MGLFKRKESRQGPVSPLGAIGGEGRSGGCVGVPLEFAFVDVETTGLAPWNDRVVEIAIVITDGLGVVRDRWCTLVNPGTGDAGPTRIHLIESDWLVAAPTFQQLAGDVASRLSGRVMVAHKSDFDVDFIEAEFERAGFPVAGSVEIPTVDTLTLANTVGLPRALQAACRQLGYYYDSHNALDDAQACAELFHRLAPVIDRDTFAAVTCGRVVGRQLAAQAVKPRSVLAEFTQYLHPHDATTGRDSAAAELYRDLVISAIEDGYIDDNEQYQLAAAAHHHRLSETDVVELHHEVVLGLIDVALEDRRISKAERTEIERAAAWLGVDVSDWEALVKASRSRVKSAQKAFADSLAGRTAVFVGRGVHPKNIREALAAKHNLAVVKSLTAKTDLVVIGSADLDNATVQKARESGIEIVVETSLWRRLGEL